jgi:hypothetical protein
LTRSKTFKNPHKILFNKMHPSKLPGFIEFVRPHVQREWLDSVLLNLAAFGLQPGCNIGLEGSKLAFDGSNLDLQTSRVGLATISRQQHIATLE